MGFVEEKGTEIKHKIQNENISSQLAPDKELWLYKQRSQNDLWIKSTLDNTCIKLSMVGCVKLT